MAERATNYCLTEWTVEITLEGPFLTASTDAGPWGLDAVCARDASGRLYLAGSLARGKLREALDDISPPEGNLGRDPFGRSRMLDRAGDDSGGWGKIKAIDQDGEASTSTAIPPRGPNIDAGRYPLIVTDFLHTTQSLGPGEQVLTRVSLDEETGAAADGQLRAIDAPLLSGEHATFRGHFRFAANDEEQCVARLDALMAALGWVAGFGAEQGTGFGRVVDTRVVGSRSLRYVADSPPRVSLRGDRFGDAASVDWTFQDPVCTPSGVVKGNIFESDPMIRGDVLKGAVAQGLREVHSLGSTDDVAVVSDPDAPFYDLCRYFSQIRFLDGIPGREGGRSRQSAPPCSLAVVDGRIVDFALTADPENALFREAPRFFHDWKPSDLALVEQEHALPPTPRQELRVRTAIDTASRRSDDSQLFAYRLLRPEGVAWKGGVVFRHADSAVHNRVWEQLCGFLAMGWIHVGKSKARGRARVAGWDDPVSRLADAIDARNWRERGVYVVTLASGALLVDPLEDSDGHARRKPSAFDESAEDPYAKVWSELSGGALKLVRRFVSHRWVGGFTAWRYRRGPAAPNDQGYYPFLLTEPGSVFVLEAVNSDCEEGVARLREWAVNGLPLPPWAKDKHGDTFQTNPFLPTNGYGEVVINDPIHERLRI